MMEPGDKVVCKHPVHSCNLEIDKVYTVKYKDHNVYYDGSDVCIWLDEVPGWFFVSRFEPADPDKEDNNGF